MSNWWFMILVFILFFLVPWKRGDDYVRGETLLVEYLWPCDDPTVPDEVKRRFNCEHN